MLNTISKNGYYLMIINSFASGTLGLLLSFVYCKWCSDTTCSGPCFQLEPEVGLLGHIGCQYYIEICLKKRQRRNLIFLVAELFTKMKSTLFSFFLRLICLFVSATERRRQSPSTHWFTSHVTKVFQIFGLGDWAPYVWTIFYRFQDVNGELGHKWTTKG